ncbi:hypothetical protein [uncultured Dysosmobacter sp.]|uniref:hypothetical protein n=1 Tax=uncultured Dysosmobacter sp. TaxID=2591384 RepID=UPI002601C629|nr:hypothetical protein [uncultured Dysosmobacter sp.]
MDELISIRDANNLVRKNFRELMKQHDFVKNKRTGFYFRIQGYFVQIFILSFLRSLPQIKCLLLPTFLYANGNLPYMDARLVRLGNQLDPKASISFSDIVIPGPPQVYRLERFNSVWKANQQILEEMLIPYLDKLDFNETLSIFQSGRNDFFETRMGAYDYVSCAAAIGQLKCSFYEESYGQLLKMRDIYAKAVAPSSKNSPFLFQKNLDYIDDLLFLLKNKPDQWKDKVSERIAKTEAETLLYWEGC